ncbi:MAG TPA: LPS export ABC transporter periplasmic protein LptC [Chroococcidiopsis sp.]
MQRSWNWTGIGRRSLIGLLLLTMMVGTVSCRTKSRTAERIEEDTEAASDISGNLTFNNVTLEQANEDGETVWKIRADQVAYSQNEEVAQAVSLSGDLYDDNKPILRVKSQRGQVQQDGKRIILQGDVVATDLRSGAVLKGDQLEWVPAEGVITIRNNVVATHPRFRVTGGEAKFFNKERRLEVSKQVVGLSRDPDLRMQGEHLTWLIDEDKVLSDRPIRVERLRDRQIVDTAVGKTAELDLKTKIVTLRQGAQLDLGSPPVRVSSSILIWSPNAQTLVSDEPLTAVHRQQQVTLRADRGRADLAQQVFYFTGNVRAVAQRNRSQMVADRLTWSVPDDRLNATGNVDYRQLNPPMRVRGPEAIGKLENETIVVSGGRVVTEIVPE